MLGKPALISGYRYSLESSLRNVIRCHGRIKETANDEGYVAAVSQR